MWDWIPSHESRLMSGAWAIEEHRSRPEPVKAVGREDEFEFIDNAEVYCSTNAFKDLLEAYVGDKLIIEWHPDSKEAVHPFTHRDDARWNLTNGHLKKLQNEPDRWGLIATGLTPYGLIWKVGEPGERMPGVVAIQIRGCRFRLDTSRD